MENCLTLLEELSNAKDFEELPDILQLALKALSKIAIHDYMRINEMAGTINILVTRSEQQQQLLNNKPTYKQIEDLMQIIHRFDAAEEQSSMDAKLTSRHSTHRPSYAKDSIASVSMESASRLSAYPQKSNADRITIEDIKSISEGVVEARLKGLSNPDMNASASKLKLKDENEIQRLLEEIRSDVIRMDTEQIASLREEIKRLNRIVADFQSSKVSEQDLNKRLAKERVVLADEATKSARKSLIREQQSANKEMVLRVNNDLDNIRNSLLKSGRKKGVELEENTIPAAFNAGNCNNVSNSVIAGTIQQMNTRIQEIRNLVMEKAEKHELVEIKLKHAKDVSKMLTQEEIERVVKKFQQQIFDRMDDDRRLIQEKIVLKSVRNEISRVIEEGGLISPDRMREIKSGVSRLQQQIVSLKSSFDSIEESIKKVQTTLKGQIKGLQSVTTKQIKSILDLISAMDEQKSQRNSISSTTSKYRRAEEQQTTTAETMYTAPSCNLGGKYSRAIWYCSANTKEAANGRICWEKQLANTSPENYIWESLKSHLYVHAAGIYELKLAVFSKRKPTGTIVLNNQTTLKFEDLQSGSKSKESGFGTSVVEFIYVPQKSKLCIKLDEQLKVTAWLCLTKLI